jgi:hypothetical protein
MYLSIEFHERNARCDAPNSVLYDISTNMACMGNGTCDGPALVWTWGAAPSAGALLACEVTLDHTSQWIVRCDRVDFPPASIAYRHTHPGPGIRCTLFGGLTIESEGLTQRYGTYQPWFEAGPEPVLARADPNHPSAFARVMLLPARWAGKRTITYVDPGEETLPKLQRPTVFFDKPLLSAAI